ncbi:MAG: ECF transporter S component [Candidatus Aenigmarchaeota archaeon]|nr:ECF transporter S component [Candidatus Aenigmarchaeota archaeon]
MKSSLARQTQQGQKETQILILNQNLTILSQTKLVLLTLLFTVAGIVGRVAFQFVPSVEPLTPISIFLGFFLGPLSGFFSGTVGFYISNYFVWGGQGLWTVFQSLGVGLAGFLSGLLGRLSKSKYLFLISLIIGSFAYEVIVTIPMAFIFSPFSPLLYIVTSIPFSIIHTVTNIGFGVLLYAFSDELRKWRFDRIERKILAIRNFDPTTNDGILRITIFHKKSKE